MTNFLAIRASLGTSLTSNRGECALKLKVEQRTPTRVVLKIEAMPCVSEWGRRSSRTFDSRPMQGTPECSNEAAL
jgi:hypothetical protein